MLSTATNKRRFVGLLLFGIILFLFVAFNRFPKLDAVGTDLEAVTSPGNAVFPGIVRREGSWNFVRSHLVGLQHDLSADRRHRHDFRVSSSGIDGSLPLSVGPRQVVPVWGIILAYRQGRRYGSGHEFVLRVHCSRVVGFSQEGGAGRGLSPWCRARRL